MNANVMTANRPSTYAVALPSPKYEPLPATAQNIRSPGPTRSATIASGTANAGERGGDPAPPAVLPRQVQHRDQRRGAGLLRERRDRDREPGPAWPIARREEHRRGHRRQHEHLEVRRLPVLGRERDRGGDEQQRGEPRGAVAPPAPGLRREQQRGERDREHRDDAHRPERGAADEGERGGVEVRDQRRLAVGGVLVERAAVADHLGLGGEERLVGVEDVDEERGQPQEGGQHEDRHDEPSATRPRVRVEWGGALEGGCELGRHHRPRDGGGPF